MEDVAHKARVASGVSGLSKAERRFRIEEGFLSARPRAPRKPRVVRNVAPKPFDLKNAVARYRRLGQLPPVDIKVAFLKTLDASGIDGAALKRMIRAMLIREGIEPNPGPEADIFGNLECSYSGQWIVGESVRSRGKKFFVCPKCAAHLTDVRGSKGRHPGGESDPGTSSAPVRSVSAPIHHLPVPPSVVVASPPHPPVMAVPVPKPAPLHILDGCNLSEEDIVAIVSRESGLDLNISDIQMEEMTVAYDGERRLASVRGVQEIKASFRAVQLSTTQTVQHEWAKFMMVFGGLMIFVGIFLSYDFFRYYAPVLIVHGTFTTNMLYAPVLLVLGGLLVWGGLKCRKPIRRSWHIPFIPHLVSAVVAEYDRGTNAVAVRSSIRSRINRLASLPIPDRDALVFINGSELICEQLLSHQNFFWEGAACFRQPL